MLTSFTRPSVARRSLGGVVTVAICASSCGSESRRSLTCTLVTARRDSRRRFLVLIQRHPHDIRTLSVTVRRVGAICVQQRRYRNRCGRSRPFDADDPVWPCRVDGGNRIELERQRLIRGSKEQNFLT